MLSARHYVEIMTTNRLSKIGREVSSDEFEEVVKRLDNLIHKFAFSNINNIDGFDEEDLQSFFLLKIYQELSFDRKYDDEFSYFSKTLQNLVRNLHRDMETAKKNLYFDAFDDKSNISPLNFRC